MIHTVKDFSALNEAELDVFLEFPCCLYDPIGAGNLMSGSSVFYKPSLYIWQFWFMYYWNLIWRILSITLLATWVQLCASLNILWHCPSLGLEWKLTFSRPVATVEFSKVAGMWVQHKLESTKCAWKPGLACCDWKMTSALVLKLDSPRLHSGSFCAYHHHESSLKMMNKLMISGEIVKLIPHLLS